MPGDIPLSRRPTAEDSPTADHGSVSSAPDAYDTQQIMAMARHPPPGASVYSPTAIPSNALNPRSCVTCRRRKVRCDKRMPCSNCRRAQIPCIFPAPGRAPRRPRPKDPNAPPKQPSSERELELMKRLRKLEGIVEELSGQIEVEAVRHPSTASTSNSPDGTHATARHHPSAATSPTTRSPGRDTPVGSAVARTPCGQGTGYDAGMPAPPVRNTSPDVHKTFGRLVLSEKGATRYVSSGLWSNINDELEELRRDAQTYTDEGSDVSEDEPSPESIINEQHAPDHRAFVFGYRSADVDLRPLHPLPSQIPFMWQVYQENIDPILKVLHVPTVGKLIRDLRNNMESLTPSTEALMFAIYYASITSLEEDEVRLNFNDEKDVLIQRYRFALEQALAKANFVTAPDLTMAQAFLLFLVLVRRHDDTRYAWTLTGLLIRISQALGLHRDGTHFPALSPFEVEMRRRMFWALLALDLRAAEDQGTDLTIVDRTFDTQLPLNINDADISPESKEVPQPRDGTTDMTFALIRYEMCALARRLHTVSSAMALVCPRDAGKSLEEREEMLNETHRRVKEKYLMKHSPDNPTWFAATTVTRVIVAKMTLVIYQPTLFPGPDSEILSEDLRTHLLYAAIDVFEYSAVLNKDPRCKQWRWLFQTYTQWHAVAYTLIELSHRPWGPTAERAWIAVNTVFSEPGEPQLQKLVDNKALWMPLKKVYMKTKRHRESEIARLKADPQAALQLDLIDLPRSVPSATFGELPGSVKSAIVLGQWRKLVNAPPLPREATPVPQPPPPLAPVQQREVMGDQKAADPSIYNQAEVMEYLDATMSEPTFVLTDFSALWGEQAAAEAARSGVYGYSSNGGLPMGAAALGYPPSPSVASVLAGGNVGLQGQQQQPQHQHQHQQQPQQTQQHQQQQQMPQGNIIMTPTSDEQLPPWLLTNTGAAEFVRAAPYMEAEHLDMSMEEGFDWHNWQESLGKFEMTNGGTAGSAWGAGI